MDRGINIAFDKIFGEKDSVFVVITFPRHISDEDIITESEFAEGSSGTVGNRLGGVDVFAFGDDRDLIYTSTLIGADKFFKVINVEYFPTSLFPSFPTSP